MRKQGLWEGNGAALAFILLAQFVLPLIALGMRHPRETEREKLMWSVMSEHQRATVIQESEQRSDAQIDSDRETPSPLDH